MSHVLIATAWAMVRDDLAAERADGAAPSLDAVLAVLNQVDPHVGREAVLAACAAQRLPLAVETTGAEERAA